jgi:hypothetical protein
MSAVSATRAAGAHPLAAMLPSKRKAEMEPEAATARLALLPLCAHHVLRC